MLNLLAERTIVIFVDVDNILVRSFGINRFPMPATIKQVKELYAQGFALYLWSSGGGEYGRESARGLGIGSLFQAFLPKHNVTINDQSVPDWRNLSPRPSKPRFLII